MKRKQKREHEYEERLRAIERQEDTVKNLQKKVRGREWSRPP